MSAIEQGKALSSRSRLKMLDLLSRRPISVEELSREVSLKTVTVRHHLNMLKRIGLVEEYGEEHRKIGRPVIRYQGEAHSMLELISKAMNGSIQEKDIDLSPLRPILVDCTIPRVCPGRSR